MMPLFFDNYSRSVPKIVEAIRSVFGFNMLALLNQNSEG